MILAAGRGIRMGVITRTVPKPLIEVRGRPLIGHLVGQLQAAGINELVINLAWLGEQIEQALGDGSDWGVTIHYSREQVGALGTGGGIRNALPLLGDQPFLVVNGDLWTDYPFARLVEHQVPAHLVLVPNPAHNRQGDFSLRTVGAKQWVVPGNRLTYAGIARLLPQWFVDQPKCFQLGPLLRQLAARNELTGERYQGQWCDVGTPERLSAIRDST